MLQLGLKLGLGPGNGILFFFFFFFSLSANVLDIVCCALLACIVDITRQYDVIGHEAVNKVDPRPERAARGSAWSNAYT